MSDDRVNPLAMSDEDFLNVVPSFGEAPIAVEEPIVTEEVAVVEEPVVTEEPIIPEDTDDKESDVPVVGSEEEVPVEKTPEEIEAEKTTAPVDPEVKTDPVETPKVEEAPDYEAVYKTLMSPIKANGKTIEIRSPEELIQLAQMGANYTKKLQDLQPHRKMLLMLQNNDLLDEGKLDYLIALDKKDPEAIKRLIKDSGIDPLEIDTTTEPAYLEGSHRVSDEEANFVSILNDLQESDTGKDTIRTIHATWDKTSMDAMAAHPEIMTVIHEQRENGIYDTITTEVDRQRTLGQISPKTPFLEAYKIVGDQLAEKNLLVPEVKSTQQEPIPVVVPEVVATRVVAPKSNLANGDKAQAAAPTRAAPKKAETLVNPLAMSDEEFLKLDKFKNRL